MNKAKVSTDFNWSLDPKNIKILDNYEIPKKSFLNQENFLFPSKITNVFWVGVYDLTLNENSKIYKENEINQLFIGGDSTDFIKKSLRLTKAKKIKSGKWTIFVNIEELDLTWQKIKLATENGLLGCYSKSATFRQNSNILSEKEKVICVYTYDWNDKKDVDRVEKALREIGIFQTLYYKTDFDSSEGRYKNRGDKLISKYISKAIVNNADNGLSSLFGLGIEKIKTLNKVGIHNIVDLINFDVSKKLLNIGISTEYIAKLKLYAKSKIENKVYKLSEFQFPTSPNMYLDIETDLTPEYSEKRIWSIAVYYDNKIEHFYAKTWKEEKKILIEFIFFLNEHREYNIFSYSKFDTTVISFVLKRYGLDSIFFSTLNHFDLFEILKKYYVLPIKSYGVKEVGSYFGYEFKHQNLNGIYAAREYEYSQMKNKNISKKLKDYIVDDVKVMAFIVEKILLEKDTSIINSLKPIPIKATTNNLSKKIKTKIEQTIKFFEIDEELLIKEEDLKIKEGAYSCPKCYKRQFYKISDAQYKCQFCNKGNLRITINRSGTTDYILF